MVFASLIESSRMSRRNLGFHCTLSDRGFFFFFFCAFSLRVSRPFLSAPRVLFSFHARNNELHTRKIGTAPLSSRSATRPILRCFLDHNQFPVSTTPSRTCFPMHVCVRACAIRRYVARSRALYADRVFSGDPRFPGIPRVYFVIRDYSVCQAQ